MKINEWDRVRDEATKVVQSADALEPLKMHVPKLHQAACGVRNASKDYDDVRRQIDKTHVELQAVLDARKAEIAAKVAEVQAWAETEERAAMEEFEKGLSNAHSAIGRLGSVLSKSLEEFRRVRARVQKVQEIVP